MLDNLDDLDDDDFMTDWERDFLSSVESQDYPLTDAQESKLAEIQALIEERRELAEAGVDWRARRR